MVVNILNPQEVLKIAVKVEENGKGLYGSLEGKAKDEKLKKIWQYLKEQEELHRQTFQGMLDNLDDYIAPESSPGEHAGYLKAVASEYIFTQGLVEKKAKELFTSDLEALDFAIHIEKESILAYSELKNYLLAQKQAVLDKVISEEKEHLVQLVLIKDKVKK
ncbi:MAG: ferritin family protein [Candidatus Omnitrophota bacterium]